MTLQDILNLINAEIVANGNQEITADVLRPILEAMIQQPNDLIGDLGDLQTSDVSNIVNAINSILSQNVKNKTALRFVSLVGVDTSQDEIAFMQQAITAQAPFTCNVGEQMVFYTQVLLGGSSTELQLQTRYYRLLSGDTLVTGFPNDLQYIMPDGDSLVEVVDTSDTDLVVDLGDIASSTVWDAFNGAAGEPFDMNNDMFVIAQSGGEDKVWKWVGGVGTFGNSATLATSADFVDLTAQPSIVSGDLPPKQITVDTYTLADSDLYRQLYFTEENTALTIPDAYTSTNASYYFRVFFAGSGSHSIVDSEATVTYNFEQGDYVLCEKKYGLNGWIVKKVGGTELETIRAWISPYDEDLAVEQYPGFVVTPEMTMVRAWVVCTEPPTGDDIEIDMVNRTDSNTTLASFTISANTNKSNVVTTFLDTVSEGDVIIFDCTQIGSSNAGGGLQLYLEIIKS